MTNYNICTDKTQHHLAKDPAFWKDLKVRDVVCGREVVREGKDTTCGWPQMDDLMSDEGRGWMVCRAGFEEPSCGCPESEEGCEYCGYIEDDLATHYEDCVHFDTDLIAKKEESE